MRHTNEPGWCQIPRPNSAANPLPGALKFRCRTTPLPEAKWLNQSIILTFAGVFSELKWIFSLPAGKCRSIAACRVDLVEQRAAGFEAADVVEDDRCGGRRVSEGGDVRRHEDTRVVPERVAGGQRLLIEDVEHRPRDLPRSEGGEQILLDEVSAARGVEECRT